MSEHDLGSYPDIAQKILAMVEKDPDMRERALRNEGAIVSSKDSRENFESTKELKRIVRLIGWPTVSMVGKVASYNAWLLVLQADHDKSFQAQCLAKMKEAMPGEVRLDQIAMLEDKVRVNLGFPQVYGTLFQEENGQHVPKPIQDPENVDLRRLRMGLDTLAENIERMNKYSPKK